MKNRWMHPYFKPDDDAGAGGGGGSDEQTGGQGGGGGDASGGGGGAPPPGDLSLRARLAGALSEEERPAFQRWADSYTSDAEFARGAVTMRSQFDGRVPIPTETATPEQVDKFWQKLGKPAEAKAYAFDFGKNDDGTPVELDDDNASWLESYKEHAHKHHYTQAQFQSGVEFFQDLEGKRQEIAVQRNNRMIDETEAALKKEWGPDYDANILAATDAGVEYSGSEQEWLEFAEMPLANGMKVGAHPTLVKALAKVGRSIAEDQRVRNMHTSGEADDIKAQIATLEEEAYKAGSTPSQEPWHGRINTLYQKLYPKKHTVNTGFGAR